MEVNEDIEIDIENKYLKNKKNTVFTIEEAIYILKRKDFCDEVEDIVIDRLIKYIKEESIPKAVVEEKIEYIDEEGYWEFTTDRDSDKAKEILQEILNKGEK